LASGCRRLRSLLSVPQHCATCQRFGDTVRGTGRLSHGARDLRSERCPRPAHCRRLRVQCGRREGATWPTWLEIKRNRRLWNAAPSGTPISPSPYQLKSITAASSPQLLSAVASPVDVALAWKTRSPIGRRPVRLGKVDAQFVRQPRARGVDIDKRNIRAGNRRD
jgi:hypothetical protein